MKYVCSAPNTDSLLAAPFLRSSSTMSWRRCKISARCWLHRLPQAERRFPPFHAFADVPALILNYPSSSTASSSDSSSFFSSSSFLSFSSFYSNLVLLLSLIDSFSEYSSALAPTLLVALLLLLQLFLLISSSFPSSMVHLFFRLRLFFI